MKVKILKFSKNNKVLKNINKIILVLLCMVTYNIHSQKTKEVKADKAYDNYNYAIDRAIQLLVLAKVKRGWTPQK